MSINPLPVVRACRDAWCDVLTLLPADGSLQGQPIMAMPPPTTWPGQYGVAGQGDLAFDPVRHHDLTDGVEVDARVTVAEAELTQAKDAADRERPR